MEMDVFKKIIHEAKAASRFTWLHLLGEPLLHPRIFDMIKICKENGMRVGLSTNAVLLDADRSRQLLDSGLDSCILAFDGIDKATYEKVRVGGHYELVGKNIDAFLRLKESLKLSRPWVVIQTVETSITENQKEEFVLRWKERNVDEILIRKYSTGAGQIKDKDSVTKPEHRYLVAPLKHRPPCFLLWNSAVILWNGDVSVCCHDGTNGRLVFGNIKRDPLAAIWNSPKIRELRQKHARSEFPSICKDCLEYPLFYPSVFYFLLLGLRRLGKKATFLCQGRKRIVSHAREQSHF